MAKTTNLAISKTLSEILRNVDVFPAYLDNDSSYRYCWAATKQGWQCKRLSRWSQQKEQICSLWSKFRIMTECPDTDDFYDQIEDFIALTHCIIHRDRALDAFTAWKAKRQAALSSPQFPSSANEISRNEQHADSPEILYGGTNVKSLDSTLAEDEGLQNTSRCPYCDKLFIQSDSLRRHIGAVHAKDEGLDEAMTEPTSNGQERIVAENLSQIKISVENARDDMVDTTLIDSGLAADTGYISLLDKEEELPGKILSHPLDIFESDIPDAPNPINIAVEDAEAEAADKSLTEEKEKPSKEQILSLPLDLFKSDIYDTPNPIDIAVKYTDAEVADKHLYGEKEKEQVREFLCPNLACERSTKGNGFIRHDQWKAHEKTTCWSQTRSPSSFGQVIAFQEEVGKSPTDENSGKSLDITQEVKTNFIAPPATDSGYGSMFATESKFGMSMRYTDAEQPTQEIIDQDMSDTATEYSNESRSTLSKKESFIRELASELFAVINTFNANETTRARVSKILPELLQAFALKIGYGATTQMHRDVMAFVYRYRREVATEFSNMNSKKDLDDSNQEKRKAEGMSWQDRTSLWFEMSSFEESPEEHVQSAARDGEALEESFPDEDEELPDSWLVAYRTFLASDSAYGELLARLQREIYLVPSELNIMGEIRERIMSSLPSPRKLSRKLSPPSCRAWFEINWDIINFFTTQGYSKEPYEAFEGVITITGTREDAQAATCAQYIKQTWPTTGEIVIRLIKDVLRGESHAHQLPNGTKISAIIDTPKFGLLVYGVSVSVAEVGELLSWLGAALRTSPRHHGLVYCTPSVRKKHPNILSSDEIELHPSSTLTMYEIEFAVEVIPQTLPAANGQCWHDIFSNPVVVRGYPIPQRLEWNTGLEISLNIMAGLARAQRTNQFKEKVYIKGFSTMLIPTKKNTDIICWHLIYNRNGERISYLDDDRDQEQYIGQLDLESYRHVLGWCSEAKLYAGSAGAHHPVTHSRLPKPYPDCALYGMRVLEGKLILSGPEFFIGAKDTPEHIPRKGNIRRLKWMSTKFVLLWDERDKRGWLINGTTALLHIVRAFLSHAKEDDFKSAFQFKDEDLQEAKAPFTADSAIDVLLNPVNKRLKLYNEDEDDDDAYLLQTQIDHFYNMLEQLIEYQTDVAGHNGSKLSNIPRRFLEGWDFEDLAKECSTIYPRVATIEDAGKGWVDFVRAIQAVTLVGRGFGDIIRPTGRGHCDSWTALPEKRYYIASCVSDLDRLLKEAGPSQDGHELLCDNLIYHAPASVYLPCQCRVTPGRKHCEPVRTLIPSTMSTTIPSTKSLTKSPEYGAVILGYSSYFPLVWGDTGSPQQGELTETENTVKVIEEDTDSGFGSNTTVSETENHSFSQRNSETESLVKPEELQSSAPNKALPNVTISIDQKIYTRNQYTVGIICPLPKELIAVRALFDSRHSNLSNISGDSNQYALGVMEGHRVVATCLPAGEYGTNAAASVASNMICNFPSVRFCLLVGIGGGVPSKKRDIRLGDVVVGQPAGTSPGVLQYDLGKEEDGNNFRLMGSLQRPPRVLTTAISSLHSDPEPLAGRLQESLSKIINYLPTYKRPGQELDDPSQATRASRNSWQRLLGSYSHIRQRLPRTPAIPTIHYGLIASGNRVIKNEKFRNRLARKHDILCFEMEAAGVINTVDCLVIRGICDYCDAQKNDVWQEYAAATAAAYAKLLLGVVAKVEQPGNVN